MKKTKVHFTHDAGQAVLDYLTEVQSWIFQHEVSAWHQLTAHVLKGPMQRIHDKLLWRREFELKINSAEAIALSIILSRYSWDDRDAFSQMAIRTLQFDLPVLTEGYQ